MNSRRWRASLYSMLVVCACAIGAASVQCAAAATSEEPSWRTIEERWYIVEMAGSRAGWSNLVIDQAGDQVRMRNAMKMKMGRGATAVEIQVHMTFTETEDGKPVAIDYEQRMARQAVKQRWQFEGDKVLHTSSQGARETTKEIPAPQGDWLPPYAADRFAKQHRAAGVDEFTFRTINPEQGLKPITVTCKRSGEAKQMHDGREVSVTVWKTTNDAIPVEVTEHFDAEGELLYQETPLGLAVLVMRSATKEEAMADGDAPAPELMARSFITPDKPIENPMKSVRAQLRLRTKDGQLPELPSAGAQRVDVGEDGRSALLTIDINNNLPASEADAADQSFSTPSVMVDFEDSLVQKLSERVEVESDDPMATAEALRKFVHRHISRKGMATAFARASETARMKEGDCSEHGVLLCALLRARGIPARVAMGLIYADAFQGHQGIFGWHMWTQALIDGKWVDFDATLPQRYNALHILTNTSALGDGLGAQDMVSIIKLMGNLEVDVVSVEYE